MPDRSGFDGAHTLKSLSSPWSISCCVVEALISRVKKSPSPLLQGVADSPMIGFLVHSPLPSTLIHFS